MKRLITRLLLTVILFTGLGQLVSCGPDKKPVKHAKYVKIQTVSCIRTSENSRYSVTYVVIDPDDPDDFVFSRPSYSLSNITKEELDSITALTK